MKLINCISFEQIELIRTCNGRNQSEKNSGLLYKKMFFKVVLSVLLWTYLVEKFSEVLLLPAGHTVVSRQTLATVVYKKGFVKVFQTNNLQSKKMKGKVHFF